MINNKLKFRAFDDGKMLYQDKVVGYTGNEDLVKIYAFLKVLRGDSILMQYTGLKDNLGKEIYDGDILKIFSNSTYVHVVYFDRGSFRLKYIFDGDWYDFGILDRYNELKLLYPSLNINFEIIGNIFETPQLL